MPNNTKWLYFGRFRMSDPERVGKSRHWKKRTMKPESVDSDRMAPPSWVFTFATWTATVYQAGFLLTSIGVRRNLPWLTNVGLIVIRLGGLILGSLYTVAIANYAAN